MPASGVAGIEPLNRDQNSADQMVDEALTAFDGPPGEHRAALDTYGTGTSRSARPPRPPGGEHLLDVQVRGSEPRACGDETHRPALLAALDEVGYSGPLNIESFTADNATIRDGGVDPASLAPTRTTWPATAWRFLLVLTTAPRRTT